jgi:hypothetical protein
MLYFVAACAGAIIGFIVAVLMAANKLRAATESWRYKKEELMGIIQSKEVPWIIGERHSF